MRLLVVSRWFPYPPTSGARQRAFYLLKGLSERHEIHLLSFTQHGSDLEHLADLAGICREVALVPLREFRPTLASGLRALVSTRPRSALACWSSTMAMLVRQQLARRKFDAAIAFTTLAGEYLAGCSVPRVLDDDNVDAAYFRRLVNVADRRVSKFRRKLTWVKVARHERRLIARFDAVAAVSEEDRRELARLAPGTQRRGRLHVVPNGVDLGLTAFTAGEVDPKRIISTGALTYQANLDAASLFCEQILPMIRAEVPDVRFLITGRHEGVNAAPLVAAGAILTGFLDDIRAVVAQSAALAVPLRIGGGTRLKILEAMALGTPVVSTTIGAAGLGLEHEKTALIADEPAEFARCVVRLMQDRALRGRMAAEARRHVAAHFGWERSVAALEAALQSAVGRGRGR